jgi:hypothetical protein
VIRNTVHAVMRRTVMRRTVMRRAKRVCQPPSDEVGSVDKATRNYGRPVIRNTVNAVMRRTVMRRAEARFVNRRRRA